MVYHRFARIAPDAVREDGHISMVASTDAPVSWGDWREVLSHAPGAVDSSAAATLLLNHRADQVSGVLRNIEARGGSLIAEADIDEDARLPTGVSVRKAVASGALRGVSIGYDYDRSDVEWDEKSRTATVRKWRLLEISLTPIPADKGASVRSLPNYLNQIHKEKPMNDETTVADDQGAHATVTTPAVDHVAHARAAAAFAISHGLDPIDSIGRSMDDLKDMALSRHLAATAEANKETEANKVTAPVRVTRDAGDKQIERMVDQMVSRFVSGKQDAPAISGRDLIERCAAIDGNATRDLAAARYCVATLRQRDAANKTTASFATLMDNTANKLLEAGFATYQGIWNTICTVKDAENYNLHSHVGVAAGKLTDNPQGDAAAELIQREGAYNSKLKRYTGTLSLTPEGLVNDPLDEVLRSFYRTGYIAARTIDHAAVAAIVGATWTHDTTTSAALGTAGNFDKVRAAFKRKLSPSGETMDNDPKILLVDPSLRYSADIATGALYGVGTGGNGMVGSNAARAMTVVDSTMLTGTATDYYLLADPMIVDTVALEFLRGHGRVPTVTSYDPGASGGVRLLMELPFAATVATHVDSAGNTRITGIQKATA